MEKNEMHLNIYQDKSILYENGTHREFLEGTQDEATLENYKKLKEELDKGYLEKLFKEVHTIGFSSLDIDTVTKGLIDSIVNKVTSEVGRALVALTFLQLTIKSIIPQQCIRLHKGGTRSNAFSWKQGISMRTIDKCYNTPFLRKHSLVNLNADGIMMTRSLAENYPYSQLYKAEMRGPFKEWINIVDSIENNNIKPDLTLKYLLAKLINRSENIDQLCKEACDAVKDIPKLSFYQCQKLLSDFFETTKYSARAFEVVIHSFMQAYIEMDFSELSLVPLSQMRSANKKHGNVGDIELESGGNIVEAWDAKYGKTYLYEELGELKEKLNNNPGVKIAGFIVNKDIEVKKEEIKERLDEVLSETDVEEIKLFNFDDWVQFKLCGISTSDLELFANKWLVATIESFARKREKIAPIDEPCDEWLKDLIKMIKNT